MSDVYGAASAIVAEEKCFERAMSHRKTRTFLIGKEPFGVAVLSGEHLRLLAISPRLRGKGAGSALIERIKQEAKADGRDRLVVAAEPGNYFEPGIHESRTESLAWLEKRGFNETARNINLVVSLAEIPTFDCDYSIGQEVAEIDFEWISETFGRAIGWECRRACRHQGLFLARDADGVLVGFAAHSGNNAGWPWFGPAGTAEAYRGKGIGRALLSTVLHDLKRKGYEEAEVAWLGPVEFYEKHVNVVSSREFFVMEVDL